MNKKLMLAVLLSLLASSSALIAGIFMLQQIKTTATVPAQVDNLRQQVSSIDTTIDLSEVEGKYENLATQFNLMAADVEQMQVNQDKLLIYVSDDGDSFVPTNNTPTTSETPTEDAVTTPDTTNDSKKSTTRLNLRENNSTNAKVIKTLTTGTTLTLLGEEKQAENYTWVKVKTSDGTTGWVAKQYLK